MKIITEEEIKEISNKATEIYNNTDLTGVESLRVAKEMILDEDIKKMEKTY